MEVHVKLINNGEKNILKCVDTPNVIVEKIKTIDKRHSQ